ncbi:hypothetical protein LJB89_02870 [Tyzzerella sp. OttesenSCG-928-J15]|nr:hypothetical protein [Tyzzerella sp. OttesenSCG-928-J15]
MAWVLTVTVLILLNQRFNSVDDGNTVISSFENRETNENDKRTMANEVLESNIQKTLMASFDFISNADIDIENIDEEYEVNVTLTLDGNIENTDIDDIVLIINKSIGNTGESNHVEIMNQQGDILYPYQ